MQTSTKVQLTAAAAVGAAALLLPFGGDALAQTAGEVPGGSLGSASDSELWRAVRGGEGALIQAEGEEWRAWRNGPLSTWGIWVLAGSMFVIAAFYLFRGRIMIEHGTSDKTIERFKLIERIGHWMTAGSFIVLALTGLNLLYGRYVFIPIMGKEAFAVITEAGKWIHNWVAFAFMAGLVMIFVMWVVHNIPNKLDLKWFMQGGGLFSKHLHPPAKKFNGGQKIIFWLTILGGTSLSLSGWALLDPFTTTMFADTFALLNAIGFNLPTDVSPIQEQQYAQLWHTIVSKFMIAAILAHIYIGSVGMQGAFSAMGSGQVDLNWAKEHHRLWVEEVQAEERKEQEASGKGQAAPAE